MRLEEFRRRATEAFGLHLEHATPANIRQFVAAIREEVFPSRKERDRFVIDEPEDDYEGIMRTYLAHVLGLDPDQAAVSLWLHTAEMWFSELEAEYDARFLEMFEEGEPEETESTP